MAKVIAVWDIDATSCKVRLDDGRTLQVPHGEGYPSIGDEFGKIQKPAAPMTVEQMNNPAQVEANILSEVAKNAEREQEAAGGDGHSGTRAPEALQPQSGTAGDEP